MSIVAFKKKSVIQYGSKRSGKPPGGYWLPQGPFGVNTYSLVEGKENYGAVGFSLNGTHRNVGYVGKDSKFSRNGMFSSCRKRVSTDQLTSHLKNSSKKPKCWRKTSSLAAST